MDYPVLVNPGKPSYACLHREGHEEENQGSGFGNRKTPENGPGRTKSRAARDPQVGKPGPGSVR
nr:MULTISPECIES: hypothetical protein [unclassified Bradyrhizobium]